VKKLTDAEKIQFEKLNRRDFLLRVGYASAVALAAGGLGLALYDSKGPAPSEAQKALTGLVDYTPPGARPPGARKWPSSGARTGA
jgi:hypothetical protein